MHAMSTALANAHNRSLVIFSVMFDEVGIFTIHKGEVYYGDLPSNTDNASFTKLSTAPIFQLKRYEARLKEFIGLTDKNDEKDIAKTMLMKVSASLEEKKDLVVEKFLAEQDRSKP